MCEVRRGFPTLPPAQILCLHRSSRRPSKRENPALRVRERSVEGRVPARRVRAALQLVEGREEVRWSSARFGLCGEAGNLRAQHRAGILGLRPIDEIAQLGRLYVEVLEDRQDDVRDHDCEGITLYVLEISERRRAYQARGGL